MLILFMGPTASGKSTLVKEVVGCRPSIKQCVRYTTREARSGEVDGVDYNFIPVIRYSQMLEKGEFAEFEEYSGERFYATSFASLQAAAKEDVCSTITPSGLVQLCSSGKDFGTILLFNCKCPLREQILRYVQRTPTFTVNDKMEMCDRLARDEGMFKGVDSIIKAMPNVYAGKFISVDLSMLQSVSMCRRIVLETIDSQNNSSEEHNK